MKTKGTSVKAGKKRKPKQAKLILILFLVSGSLYMGCRLGLNSYNTRLSRTNQELVNEISDAQSEIDDLQVEVNLLQDKNRILGMLDYQGGGNQNNIYVIDQN